jgi:O-antigen biosynthesis protein WbqP
VYGRFVKRVLDIVLAVVALALLWPVFLVTAVAIRLHDGGPAIFRQQRVGRGCAPFTLYKFRSMSVNAPNVPSAVGAAALITPVGRIIRRANIDELPQLFNVLAGDMSVVGPRPALPSQTWLVDERRRAGVDRLRPGLTGLAQINAYDGMPDTEKLGWETRYLQRVSWRQDLMVVLRTFGYLLRRPPVY